MASRIGIQALISNITQISWISKKNTLPETNSSPLKINGWSRGISFWDGPVAGAKILVSGSVVVASDQQTVVYPTKNLVKTRIFLNFQGENKKHL